MLGGLDGISSIARSFSPARALTSLTGNPDADRYVAILKSSTVASEMIRRFDLIKVYDITSFPMEKAAKELESNTDITVETEGNIVVSVFDKDPQRAADMANAYVELLNKTNSQLMVQNAGGDREFIEQRYRKNRLDLAAAEDSLKTFQQRHGVIALPEQLTASIKAVAEMEGQLAVKEVQANVLRRIQSPDNPAVTNLEIEIQEFRRKLTDLNTGEDKNMGPLVSFSKMPELGTQYIRRFREVEIQYRILQFIMPLYEQAKVEEQRQTPSVLVLDRASVPEHKAKPKIALFALLGLVTSSLLALMIVLLREGVSKLNASDPSRFERLLRQARSDWFGLKIWGTRNRSHE